MTHEEVVAFYQYLIDRRLVPRLHDSYGRIARILIERGPTASWTWLVIGLNVWHAPWRVRT